jgi:hypothetical protein
MSPSGTEYLGALGGIMALRDAVPTSQPPPAPAKATRTTKRKHHRTRHRISHRPRRAAGFTG